MIKLVKTVKSIFTAVMIIIAVLIFLIVGYEIFGAAYNSCSADKQTKEIVDIIGDISDIDILDKYTFSGNSSGTGNHCDMLSLVLVRTENIESVDSQMQGYKGCEIFEYSELNEYNRQYYDNLDFPENTENCYIIRVCNSAPFNDNITGH